MWPMALFGGRGSVRLEGYTFLPATTTTRLSHSEPCSKVIAALCCLYTLVSLLNGLQLSPCFVPATGCLSHADKSGQRSVILDAGWDDRSRQLTGAQCLSGLGHSADYWAWCCFLL